MNVLIFQFNWRFSGFLHRCSCEERRKQWYAKQASRWWWSEASPAIVTEELVNGGDRFACSCSNPMNATYQKSIPIAYTYYWCVQIRFRCNWTIVGSFLIFVYNCSCPLGFNISNGWQKKIKNCINIIKETTINAGSFEESINKIKIYTIKTHQHFC